MTTIDTQVNNLIINTMTKEQYDSITPSATELYMITDEVFYTAGNGIDSTALQNGTLQVSTTVASKTDIGAGNTTIQRNGVAIGTINANQTSAGTINISVPTTASEVGALPSSTTIGDGKTIFKKNNTAFATISANQTGTINIDYTIPTQASDIGALPDTTTIGNGDIVFKKNGTAFTTASANQTSTTTVDYTIPTVPTTVSSFTNDSGYITSADLAPYQLISRTIVDLGTTSGSVSLTNNKEHKITASGNVTFSLPTGSSTTFGEMLVELYMASAYTINLGTSNYFNGTAPNMSSAGYYTIIYEYDSVRGGWTVGALKKA